MDISSGFIYGELHDQVTRWIARINQQNITKWILYLSVGSEGEKISLEQLQQELKTREGHKVPLDTIRDILVKLSRGDLVDYLELGGWFRKVNDPILLEFLKVWGKIEVEGQSPKAVRDDLRERYETLERRFHEYKGYLGEVFMSQILLNSSRVRAERSPRTLRLWLFAYSGLTPQAQAFAREHNILWSSKAEMNELLRLLGLRDLPDVSLDES